MSDEMIKAQADRVLNGLELDINTYHPVAWGIPWGAESIENINKIIAYYEGYKIDCVKKLPGTSEIGRKTFQEFIRLADLEIESVESILLMIKRGK